MNEVTPVNTGTIRDKKGKFKKGFSGNPNGKPVGSGISITTEIKRKLAEVPKGQKATYLKLLLDKIMDLAVKQGDQQMIGKIWNYIDGMPPQSITANIKVKKIEGFVYEFPVEDVKELVNDSKGKTRVQATPSIPEVK